MFLNLNKNIFVFTVKYTGDVTLTKLYAIFLYTVRKFVLVHSLPFQNHVICTVELKNLADIALFFNKWYFKYLKYETISKSSSETNCLNFVALSCVCKIVKYPQLLREIFQNFPNLSKVWQIPRPFKIIRGTFKI